MRNIILKNLAIFAMILSSFVFANETRLREEFLKNIDQEIKNVENFYQHEQEWLVKNFVPIVYGVKSLKENLVKINKEIDSLGGIEKIDKEYNPALIEKLQKINDQLEREYAILFLSYLKLSKAIESHPDVFRETQMLLSQASTLYDDTDKRLKLVLATIEKNDPDNRIIQDIKNLQKSHEQQLKIAPEVLKSSLKNQINEINMYLKQAHNSKLRNFWIYARQSYDRIFVLPELLVLDPKSIEEIHKKIVDSEISVADGKRALLVRLSKVDKQKANYTEDEEAFFEDFENNPNPTEEDFERALELILKIEIRQYGSRQDQSSLRLCVHKDNTVKKAQFILCAAKSGGHQEKSKDRYVMERGRVAADRREAKIIGGIRIGDLSHSGEVEAEDIIERSRSLALPDPPSGNTKEHIDSKIANKDYWSRGQKMADNSFDSKSDTSFYRDLHSAESRSELKSEAEKISREANGRDDVLSSKTEQLAQSITGSEQAFKGQVSRMLVDANALDTEQPLFRESKNFDLSSNNSQNIQHTINSARKAVAILKRINESAPGSNINRISNGLDATNAVLDAAEKALNDNNFDSSKSLLNTAMSMIDAYGPLALRISINFTPVNDLADLVEFVSGKDVVTGEDIGASGRAFAALGLVMGNRQLWGEIGNYLKGPETEFAEEFAKDISEYEHFSPVTKEGPLRGDQLNSFRSGTYNRMVRSKPTTLYSVSHEGRKVGEYWSLVKPEGPTQQLIDNAIHSKFGNKAIQILKVELPAGQEMYEGIVSGYEKMSGAGVRQIYIKEKVLETLNIISREGF